MKFKQIVILNNIGVSDETMAALKNLSENPLKIWNEEPKNDDEIKEKLTGADCCLLSYRGRLSREVLLGCPDLKFINICGTSFAGIDLETCRQKNIIVSNLYDYGDEGVVEYIILQLLNLVRGVGQYHWSASRAELNGKTIGVIGLGVVGKLLAQAALGLKMNVLYNSLERNPDLEKLGIIFVDKTELLKRSDFISLHTPRDLEIIKKEDFDLMVGKVLINTTLGKAFTEDNFKEWIAKPGNFAIMDNATHPDFYREFHELDRVMMIDSVSGATEESILRLGQKVLDNINAYLAGQPINEVK